MSSPRVCVNAQNTHTVRVINYDSPASLAAFLREHGLGMQKKFGQNFLINAGVRTALLNALEIVPRAEVWEIGPGLGAMTAGLLERGARVTAFEIDRGFCAALTTLFGGEDSFNLVQGSVLQTLIQRAPECVRGVKLLGNLPYNIAAKLLAECVERGLLFERIVITVQREVARRITARMGTADYAPLSVLMSQSYQIQSLGVLKGESFFPAPRVDSQMLKLDVRPEARAARPPAVFFSLLRALFASRRKTVKNNLAAFLDGYYRSNTDAHGKPRDGAESLLSACGIAAGERAERLRPEDFLRLAESLTAA